MVLSVSRRTDIPAFYSDWFYNRVRAGFVCVRNPMNIHQVSRIQINPDVVDGIVFWSKNPAPMIDKLPIISNYTYYFQFTINPYGTDIEPNIPPLENRIDTLLQISNLRGVGSVIWRYDPILISNKYNVEFHKNAFRNISEKLSGHIEKCIFSFIDIYRKIEGKTDSLGVRAPTSDEQMEISRMISETADRYSFSAETCAETIDLAKIGICHASCVDGKLLARLGGYVLNMPGNRPERPGCGCAKSVDIGEYNSCPHRCVYCYANRGGILPTSAICQMKNDPDSPLLIGNITETDNVYDRKIDRYRSAQIMLPFYPDS